MRIGIFLPHWLGDACMATPMLRAISDHFRDPSVGPSDCEIVAIARGPVVELLEGSTWFDESWLWKKNLRDQMDLVLRMRRQRFDTLFILPGSFRTGMLGWLSGARQRIGYSGNLRNGFLTDQIRKPDNRPLVNEYLRLARLGGCRKFTTRTELPITAIDDANAAKVWDDLALGSNVVGLNCGSAKSPSRRWPADRFAKLGRQVADQMQHDVLVVCGPGEESIANQVVLLADHPRIKSFAGQPMDLGTSKAVLGRLDLLVSNDSGPRHIASAMNTPVVSLHGPVTPEANANPLSNDLAIISDLPCVGCCKDECPLGHNDCMSEIGVDQVMSAIRNLVPRRSAA